MALRTCPFDRGKGAGRLANESPKNRGPIEENFTYAPLLYRIRRGMADSAFRKVVFLAIQSQFDPQYFVR